MRPHLSLVTATMSAMTVAAGVDHFIDHLRRRGYALNTLRSYGNDLQQFEAFVQRLHQGDLVAVMSRHHVSRFLDDRSAADDTPRTQARKLAAVRSFFRHAQREGWIGFDPTAEERIKVRTKRTLAPELDQLADVIAKIPRDGTNNLRDRALLRLLLDTGVRISCLLQADLPGTMGQTSIDLRRGLLHFENKGGDIETSPFNEATGNAVEAWLTVRPQLAMPGLTALFVGGKGQRLSRGSAHAIIKSRGKAAGLDDLHAHLFRHRRGASVLEACGDKAAQQFLHHQSLNTTSIYGHSAVTRRVGVIRAMADVDALTERARAQA